jgi:hypothetical protein
MRRPKAALVAAIAASLVTASLFACETPTRPCGSFAFAGTSETNGGVDARVSFHFTPTQCGLTADNPFTQAYVQIVRVINRDDGSFLAPSPEQQNRIVTTSRSATENGWAVDRIEGRSWGYYGRFDDGTFAANLTPGNTTTDAVLRDGPYGWRPNVWFDAVSVPVCIVGTHCGNRLAGYYYWLFIVNPNGSGTDPLSEVGVAWMRDSFDLAVAEWNTDAPGLGKHTFPALSRI